MRAYDLTVTGSLIVSGSTTLTGDISYDDVTATGNIETTGANKVVSGSVTSTGSFGTLIAGGEYGSLLIGTKTRQTGFNNQLLIESASPGILLKDNSGGNQATQFYTIYSANGIINHFFDHEKSIEFSHTTDIIGNNENIMLKIDANNVEFPYANTKISGSVTSTGSFGAAHISDRIGIGTQSPTTELVVEAADSPEILLVKRGATGAHIRYQQESGVLQIGGDSGLNTGIYS